MLIKQTSPSLLLHIGAITTDTMSSSKGRNQSHVPHSHQHKMPCWGALLLVWGSVVKWSWCAVPPACLKMSEDFGHEAVPLHPFLLCILSHMCSPLQVPITVLALSAIPSVHWQIQQGIAPAMCLRLQTSPSRCWGVALSRLAPAGLQGCLLTRSAVMLQRKRSLHLQMLATLIPVCESPLSQSN